MATRPIVPRATGEGSIGTSAKHWSNIYADNGNIAGRNIATDGVTLDNNSSAITVLQGQVTTLEHAYAGAKAAATVADMTDHNQIYVYVGSESGYTNGNWYYWNGTAWTSGGVYNATALETDKTLTISGAAADALVTGDRISTNSKPLERVLLNNPVASCNWVDNKYMDATGHIQDNNDYAYSSPVAVNVDCDPVIHFVDGHQWFANFFDSNNTWIAGRYMDAGKNTLVIAKSIFAPNGGVIYVVLSAEKNQVNKFWIQQEKLSSLLFSQIVDAKKLPAYELVGFYPNLNDGALNINDDYKTSTPIAVIPGSKCTVEYTGNEAVFIVFYDKNNAKISAEYVTGTTSFIVPDKCVYMRYGYKINDSVEISVEGVGIINDKVKSLDTLVKRLINNDFALETTTGLIDGYYPSWGNGELAESADHDYSASPFIPVMGGAKLVVDGVSTDVNAICFYDEQKKFISGGFQSLIYQIPEDARYLRYGIKTVDINTASISLVREHDNMVIVVDKNGNGDFTTINEALTYAYTIESINNKVTIKINPGIYEESLVIGGRHYVSLIGVNPKDCIIINNSAMYDNAPIRISGDCYVENLSFISGTSAYTSSTGTGTAAWKADVMNGVKNPAWLSTIGQYAVHCDDEPNDDGKEKNCVFKNCYMYSESFPAFGGGMQKNQQIQLINCKLEDNIDADILAYDTTHNTGNCQGVLLCHGNFPGGTDVVNVNQSLLVKECIIKGNIPKMVRMYPSPQAPVADIIFIDNTFIPQGATSESDCINFEFDTQNITKASHGNNLNFFNKNLFD